MWCYVYIYKVKSVPFPYLFISRLNLAPQKGLNLELPFSSVIIRRTWIY